MELSYSDQLREALRGIRAAAIEHGVPDEVAAAIAHGEVVARTAPTPANAPSSAWMEAVARAAAEYAAVHGRNNSDLPLSTITAEAVELAMRKPPPAAPGGPNG